MKTTVLLLLLSVGCAASGPSLDRATISTVTFGVPSGWSSKDLSTPSLQMLEWTPPYNDRPESLSIIRREMAAISKHHDRLGGLLLKASGQLDHATFKRPDRISTKHGLVGARIEGSFVPAGQLTPYQRIHAVLVEGTHLVHVIYTGQELDREVFEAVLVTYKLS